MTLVPTSLPRLRVLEMPRTREMLPHDSNGAVQKRDGLEGLLKP